MTDSRKFKCNCISKFQDKRNGKGKRIFNPLQGNKKGFRCTVCGRIKETV